MEIILKTELQVTSNASVRLRNIGGNAYHTQNVQSAIMTQYAL